MEANVTYHAHGKKHLAAKRAGEGDGRHETRRDGEEGKCAHHATHSAVPSLTARCGLTATDSAARLVLGDWPRRRRDRVGPQLQRAAQPLHLKDAERERRSSKGGGSVASAEGREVKGRGRRIAWRCHGYAEGTWR
eukprot:3977207-Pleurochrysis_carterae.AAC.1